jgi:uncharacterized membrane protein
MNWAQRYRLKRSVHTSLVLWPTVSLVAALICAPTVRWLDRKTDMVSFGFSPDGTRAVLSMFAGSMLTFIVFVLSATLIVVQLASGQLTPRVIALVLASPGVKVVLGSLTFTYAYTLSALAIAIFLNLACIVVFFLFVQQLSNGLRPAALLHLVAEHGERVIEQVYPPVEDVRRTQQSTGEVLKTASPHMVELKGRSGVIMAFSPENIVRLARQNDAVVELVPQVGDSIAKGDPLFRIYGTAIPVSEDELRGCVAIGIERTFDQDPRFVFRVLVDIANKALSPAINDPTTAVLALDQICHLLKRLGRRRLDDGFARDESGQLRLVYGTPNWDDFVILAVSEIRHFGEGSLQITRRLRAMLDHLLETLPDTRHAALRSELTMLEAAIARNFPDDEDRKRAGIPDYQGVGGADS